MSLLIRSLGRVALVLPVLLMSAQLTFASDAKTAISESVQKEQPAPAKVTKKNAIGLTISKPDQVSSGGSTGTRGGNRNYVYFNVNNLSSTIYTFGSSNESITVAVIRLQSKLKSLLAARIIKQMLGNTNTSKTHQLKAMR